MKIRNKIILIVISLTLAFVLMSNYAFKDFFADYLEKQEKAQINEISSSVSSYINEKLIKYQGIVNDWGHWDDTYNFMNNNNLDYIDKNLLEYTFDDLDINFFILFDENNAIITKRFYNANSNKFIQFPENFIDDMGKLSRSSSKEDTTSIVKIGDQFYFLAFSAITDSNKEQPAHGRIVMGRLINDSSIANLEAMTNGKIAISAINFVSGETVKGIPWKENNNITVSPPVLNDCLDSYLINFIILADDGSSGVKLSLNKDRDLYIEGMQQINRFLWIYAICMILILFIVFYSLGKYISLPFIKLIAEVKNLDLTTTKIQKLKTYGNDEFSFLRKSINNMLGRIEAEQYKVKESEEKLYSTLKSVGDGVIAVDRNGIVDFMNPVAQKLTGWHQEEAYGEQFDTVFDIINEYTGERVESPVRKVFEVEEIIELANHTILISKDGTHRPIEDTAAPIKDSFGILIGVVLVFRDCSDRKEKRKQIEYLSYHDQLTGLYNRRFFEEELMRLDNNRNLPLSFIFADINGLKTINDAFGHQCGDLLIKQVAEVLQRECRTDDIIARTGGDEFIILLPKTDSEAAKKLTDRLRNEIELEKIMDLNMSISIGYDTKNTENQATWDVLENAEDSMYRKKIIDSSRKRSEVIKSIIHTLYLKSPQEKNHSQKASFICKAIANAYNLSEEEAHELSMVGELHDIGKISVDEAVLNKIDKLSESEWVQMKRHPEIGYRLLGTSSEYYSIAEYVLAHHEKWDGSGYPKGLKGEAIPWKARIITLAEAYAAMTCEYSYRKPFNENEIAAEIKEKAGTQFDPDIARVFVEKVLGLKW